MTYDTNSPLFLIIIPYYYFTTRRNVIPFSWNRFFINPHQFVSFSTINRIVTEYKQGVFKRERLVSKNVFEQIFTPCIYRNQHFSFYDSSLKLKIKKGKKENVRPCWRKKKNPYASALNFIHIFHSTYKIYESP